MINPEFIFPFFIFSVPQDDIPIGLLKSKKLGIKNVIIEMDLTYYAIDYKIFNANVMCDLLLKRLEWIHENLGKNFY